MITKIASVMVTFLLLAIVIIVFLRFIWGLFLSIIDDED